MDVRKIIQEFYHHFEKMDLEKILSCFAPHAMVESPTLGKMEAHLFYRELFSKAKRFKATLKDIFVNPDKPHRTAAYADFGWETKEGHMMYFESVCIFEINEHGKIKMLHIIYDAERARMALRKAV